MILCIGGKLAFEQLTHRVIKRRKSEVLFNFLKYADADIVYENLCFNIDLHDHYLKLFSRRMINDIIDHFTECIRPYLLNI